MKVHGKIMEIDMKWSKETQGHFKDAICETHPTCCGFGVVWPLCKRSQHQKLCAGWDREYQMSDAELEKQPSTLTASCFAALNFAHPLSS